jgi:hypothetical protein
MYWPAASIYMQQAKRHATWMCWFNPITLAGFGAIFHIYGVDSWNVPEIIFGCRRNSTGSAIALQFTKSSTTRAEQVSSTGMITNGDGWVHLAVTRAEDSVIFYRNGKQHSSHTLAAADNVDISWYATRPVMMLTRSETNAGEGQTAAQVAWGAMWYRALAPGEIWELSQNPHAFLRVTGSRLWMPEAAAGGGTTLAAGAQTVTFTAPVANPLTTVIRAAGGNTVLFTAPTAGISSGSILPAGGQTILFTAPTAPLVATRVLPGGPNTVTTTAPAATVLGGATIVAAGTAQINLTAPTAQLILPGGAQPVSHDPSTLGALSPLQAPHSPRIGL